MMASDFTSGIREERMLSYPDIDPIIVSFGPLKVRWYGAMYLIGFLTAWWLGRYRAKKPDSGWTTQQVDDLVTYLVIGLILGGRLGYALFYDISHYVAHPLDIVKLWHGGMSFHGGVLGVIFAGWFFARKHKKAAPAVGDFLVPLAPPGLLCGRLGNFINAELWGRTTDVPWAMVFPGAGPVPRHPSQLYEAFLEGLVLFVILWWYSSKKRPPWAVTGLFLLSYGAFRFFVEFFREPDAHLGFIAFDWMSMGQLLCLPMILMGVFLMLRAYAREGRT